MAELYGIEAPSACAQHQPSHTLPGQRLTLLQSWHHTHLVCVVAFPRQLQDVGECTGLLPAAAALLAHAPVASHKEGQPKHDAQPDHDKQCDKPLQHITFSPTLQASLCVGRDYSCNSICFHPSPLIPVWLKACSMRIMQCTIRRRIDALYQDLRRDETGRQLNAGTLPISL